MKSKWLLKAGKMLAIAIIVVFVIGCVVMLLWNALVPELFKGPVITYWQAIGLLVLSHILLRGWGHDRHHWRHERLSYKLEQRLAGMTPEEREKFKNRLHHRWYDIPTEGEAEEEK
jgi:amino acid transporter